MDNTLVSIIIPVYNKEQYLSQTLDSVINQNFDSMEIILINDGSKDNSVNICKEYAEKCDKIVFVDQENSGASASRNNGLNIARGKYILIVDADDEIAPGMIEKMVTIAEENSLDLVCCNFTTISSNNQEDFVYSYDKNKVLNRDYLIKYIIPNTIGLDNKMSALGYHCSLLYRKKMIDDNNIRYDEKQTKEEDKPFIVKCLAVANNIWFVEDCFYRYIKREDSLITKYSKRYDNCVKNLNLYEDLFGSIFNFKSSKKINYNLDIFEECIQFVYSHKKDVKSVKSEILEMIQKPETKKWFLEYNGQNQVRNKAKELFMDDNFIAVYNLYKTHYRMFRLKIFIRNVVK